MIKLCRLEEILSFEELIKKIEALEKRLSASFTSEEGMSIGRISDPGLKWEREEKDEGDPENSKNTVNTQDWDNLIQYLASKNVSMSNVLKEWRLLNLTEKTLEIARGNNSFSSSYLDEPERLDKFSSYCREFFQRDMKIKIVNAIQDTDEETDLAGQEKTDTEKAKYSNLPPSVKEVLEVFEGEIKKEIPAKNMRTKDSGGSLG
jgi:hypothetical protein